MVQVLPLNPKPETLNSHRGSALKVMFLVLGRALFGDSSILVENNNPKALRTHNIKFFWPKDRTIQGFWAILSLRVRVTRTAITSTVIMITTDDKNSNSHS